MDFLRRSIFVRIVLLTILAFYLGLGAVHLIGELGHVPAYGDTPEYLILATVMKVDQYRGILYPAFLAGADRLLDHRLLTGYEAMNVAMFGLPSTLPKSAIWIQLVQLLFAALAMVYALDAVLPVYRRRRLLLAFLAAIVFFDPVVAHLNVALLTDGPCLSFLLLLAGGLASLARGRGKPWFAWFMVFLGGMGSSLLRVEKSWVVLTVLLLFAGIILWFLQEKGHRIDPVEESKTNRTMRHDAHRGIGRGVQRRTFLALVALALLIAFGSQAVNHAFYAPTARWPRKISWLNERVIRPHLHAIQRDLPWKLRSRLSPELVVEYDSSVQGARKVMNELSGGDRDRVSEITHEMASVVLRKHPGALAAEVARNGVENLLITPDFYLRLAASASGRAPSFWSQRADGNVWTYEMMTQNHPRRGRFLMIMAAVFTLVAAVFSVARMRRALKRGAKPDSTTVLSLSPLLLLWLVNAAAFTAAGELVHIRYGLVAHATTLGLIWFPVLLQLWATGEEF